MRRLTIAGAIIVYLGVLYVLVAGVQQLAAALRYPTPVDMTYADFVREHPSDGWYRITDAAVRPDEYHGRVGLTRTPVLPLRGSTDTQGKIVAFVVPNNPEVLGTLRQIDGLSPDARAGYLRDHPDKTLINRPVQGGIVTSLDPAVWNLPAVERGYVDVDRGHAVLLTEGDAPRVDRSSFMILVALLLGYLAFRWFDYCLDPLRAARMKKAMEPATEVQASKSGDIPWWEQPSSTSTKPNNKRD